MHGPETGSTPGRRPPEQSADALRRSSPAWPARLRPEAAGPGAFLILESRILNSKRQGQQVKDWRLRMRSREMEATEPQAAWTRQLRKSSPTPSQLNSIAGPH